MGLSSGVRIGSYEIVAPVGAGGMGEVYRTRDIRLQRFAAIKVIKPDAADDELVRRFETEALSASALNHPNILTVYEFGVHEGLHYLATEFIEGETLRARLKRGALPVRVAVDIALQAASALEAAHEAGLIHRDIKPENIMIRPDGYVKVLDFGLAKLAPGTAAAAENMTISLRTSPGVILGTVGYMSPEQVRGADLDQRADLWSLGTVLHEMVSGRSPFAGQTVGDVVAAVLERQPPPLTATGLHIPPELERIVNKSLSKSTDDRYQTATDLLIDLRRLKAQLDREAEGQPSRLGPGGNATILHDRPARSSRAAIAAALAVLLLGGGGWAVWKSQQQPPAAPTRAFEFWLTVQHTRDGKPDGEEFPSSPAVVFIRGSKFTVNFIGPEPGYLYLLNDGPGEKGRVLHHLHPTALTAGSTQVPGGQVVKTGANFMDTNAGTEDLWVVWSKNEVPELEASRKYADTTHFGTVNDDALANRVRALLAEHSKNVVAEERKDPSGAFKRMVVRGPDDIIAFMAPLAHR